MSREDVEAFRRAVSAFDQRDWDAYLEVMSPDVEAVPLLVRMEGDYHGHAGVRRWLRDLFDIFPDFAIEVLEVRDLGDVTFAAMRYRAHAAESDAPIEARLWIVGRWRRGECVWWGNFATEAEALEAVGLRE